MACTIEAVTTSGGGLVYSADASGELIIKSGILPIVSIKSTGVTISTPLPVLSGGTGVIISTGTGSTVLNLSPSLTNPTVTDYVETFVPLGTTGSTRTLSLSAGTVISTILTSATPATFTMPALVAGKSFCLLLHQPVAGTPTTVAFTNVKWGISGAFIATATLGKMDIISFICDGTYWYGSVSRGFTS